MCATAQQQNPPMSYVEKKSIICLNFTCDKYRRVDMEERSSMHTLCTMHTAHYAQCELSNPEIKMRNSPFRIGKKFDHPFSPNIHFIGQTNIRNARNVTAINTILYIYFVTSHNDLLIESFSSVSSIQNTMFLFIDLFSENHPNVTMHYGLIDSLIVARCYFAFDKCH